MIALLFRPVVVMIGVIALCVIALAMAYMAEFVFLLKPCQLCLWQRIPFALAALVGLGALATRGRHLRLVLPVGFALMGAMLAGNSALAFFHSGVERHWWPGFDGCAAPVSGGSVQDMLEAIRSAPVVRCDEIPWELFGLSMANYNVAFCAALATVCAVMAVRSIAARPA